MAADDCVKSQDSSTDSLPADMQQLKESVEKALKKPLIKEETWWVPEIHKKQGKWACPTFGQSSMTGVILTRFQYLNKNCNVLHFYAILIFQSRLCQSDLRFDIIHQNATKIMRFFQKILFMWQNQFSRLCLLNYAFFQCRRKGRIHSSFCFCHALIEFTFSGIWSMRGGSNSWKST